MKLLRQIKLACLIVVMSLASIEDARAGRERQRSLSEMDAASSLVIDGVVTAVTELNTKEQTPPAKNIGLEIHRRAVFRIEKIHKGRLNDHTDFVYLEYWKNLDPGYKGDMAPDLAVGDRFRLYAYADAVEFDQAGKPHVFVLTPNAVRPEALHMKELPTLPEDQVAMSDSVPQLPIGVLPESRTKMVSEANLIVPEPSEEPASSTPWSIIGVLIAAALGLLWLLLKRRS